MFTQDYENDALNNLKKILINKWDFVTMQAEEQVRWKNKETKWNSIVSYHFIIKNDRRNAEGTLRQNLTLFTFDI